MLNRYSIQITTPSGKTTGGTIRAISEAKVREHVSAKVPAGSTIVITKI